ncbi:MAG: alanine racemase [Lysobacteraceae bacterium]|nr:MAG: alanine racemase [Xanthomonadaceae bacterium]
MKISQMGTPALLLDRNKLQRNIDVMQSRLQSLKVPFRVHLKTAKCAKIAAMVLSPNNPSITVSTVREAEYFFDHGVRDFLYAVGIAPNKLSRVAQLMKKGAVVRLCLDSMVQARALQEAGSNCGLAYDAVIEIDCDGHRGGLPPQSPEIDQIARYLKGSSNVRFCGLMTHAGGSYDMRDIDGIRTMAAQERDAVVSCGQRLSDQGLRSEILSAGSTPTATYGQDWSGLTEVRAGVYLFHDLVMAGLGVCSIDDIALSVLACVIAVQPERQRLIVDAGWMALSRDRGTADHAVDQGYGLVCDINGRPLGDLVVTETNQEHGIVASRTGAPIDFERLCVGSLVRVLPSHACATAAMHRHYHVVDGQEANAVWCRDDGW